MKAQAKLLALVAVAVPLLMSAAWVHAKTKVHGVPTAGDWGQLNMVLEEGLSLASASNTAERPFVITHVLYEFALAPGVVMPVSYAVNGAPVWYSLVGAHDDPMRIPVRPGQEFSIELDAPAKATTKVVVRGYWEEV